MKQHRPLQPEKARSDYQPKARVVPLNSAAWQCLRSVVLAEEPLCRHCSDNHGRVTPATDVDHIDNNGDNNERDNLCPLCHECHSRKTRAEQLGKAPRKVYGCDTDGRPLDPQHHWNRKDHEQPPALAPQPNHARAAADEEFRS